MTQHTGQLHSTVDPTLKPVPVCAGRSDAKGTAPTPKPGAGAGMDDSLSIGPHCHRATQPGGQGHHNSKTVATIPVPTTKAQLKRKTIVKSKPFQINYTSLN